MHLNALILKVEIKKNPAFSERTGQPNPSYFLEGTVIDMDTNKKYRCSFRKAFGAELLQQAYIQKTSEAERDALAAEVVTNAKQQLEHQEKALIVEDIRTQEDLITLIVRPA